MKSVAALVVVALLGCNPKPTVILGGVMAAGGGLLIATAPSDDTDRLFGSPHDNAVGAGNFFIVTGLIVALIGAVEYGLQNTESEKQSQPPIGGIAAPPAPFPVTDTDPTAYVTEPPVVASPAVPLPAASLTYDNPTQRQFAYQASSAARRGNCSAAVASGKQLTLENDQKLLAADAAYARCVADR